MTTRRTFLKFAVLAAGAFAAGPEIAARAADARPLIDGVAEACRRLALSGWRQLLLDVTGGDLDIAAADLPVQLSKSLPHIDRAIAGFGDFAVAGTRAIEPGRPDNGLLYHALAAPSVVADSKGAELHGFPTLAEIEAVENYSLWRCPADPGRSAPPRRRPAFRHRRIRATVPQRAAVGARPPRRVVLRACRNQSSRHHRTPVRRQGA
jgi:hypothetical protein